MTRDSAFADLRTIDDLNGFLGGPGGAPRLLYKHSLTCGTSGWAMEELRDLASTAGQDVRIGIVLVQPGRDVSNEIARRFGVRHESPQILLVHDGKAVWVASHHSVTARAASEAIDRLRQDATSLPSPTPGPGL